MMKKFILTTLVLVVCGAGAYAAYQYTRGSAVTSSSDGPYVVPPLTEPYTNNDYAFSLKVPTGYSVREMPAGDGETVLIESATGPGVQIVITPLDEDIKDLTKERIQHDVPDLILSDEQVVEVGEQHTGLAFKSNNPAFDGHSREVWFVFRSNLYQISTYEKFDPLLKALFATWQFL